MMRHGQIGRRLSVDWGISKRPSFFIKKSCFFPQLSNFHQRKGVKICPNLLTRAFVQNQLFNIFPPVLETSKSINPLWSYVLFKIQILIYFLHVMCPLLFLNTGHKFLLLNSYLLIVFPQKILQIDITFNFTILP